MLAALSRNDCVSISDLARVFAMMIAVGCCESKGFGSFFKTGNQSHCLFQFLDGFLLVEP
jgi:hypothetical protein